MHHCWWCGEKTISFSQDINLNTTVIYSRLECFTCHLTKTDWFHGDDREKVAQIEWEKGNVTFPVIVELPKRIYVVSRIDNMFTIEIENIDISEHLKRLLSFVIKPDKKILPHRFTLKENNIIHHDCQLIDYKGFVQSKSVFKDWRASHFTFISRGFTWKRESSIDKAWLKKTKAVIPPFHNKVAKALGIDGF